MQQRQIMLWVLLGTIWLLGGCVAPDGSVIRFMQALDGTIVGWEVDAPAVKSVDIANVPAYPPRPILYLGQVEDEWGIVGVDSDGHSLGIVANGILLGWSHQGKHFAYIARDDTTEVESLVVTQLDGSAHTLMQAAPDEERFVRSWQSVWSPDDSSLVVLLENKAGFSLAVFGLDSLQPPQRFTLPIEAYTRDGSRYNWPPYTLKWSPDGQKVLLAWEQTLVVNVTSGEIEVIVPFPTMAEWMPSSDAVVYFEVMVTPELYLKPLGGDTSLVLDSATLAEWGLSEYTFFSAPLLKLSPSGNTLAISAIQNSRQSTVILAYNVGMIEDDIWTTPAQQIILNDVGVAGWEWGPDEQEMAMLVSSDTGLTIDVLTLSNGTRRTLTPMGKLEGIEIDVIALLNMISWVP